MAKTGVFIATCNIFTKQIEWLREILTPIRLKYDVQTLEPVLEPVVTDSLKTPRLKRGFVIHNHPDIIQLRSSLPIQPKEEILFDKDKARKLYYRLVWKHTLAHGVDKIMRGFPRGFYDYHIDHVIPISYGFKHGILPSIIGAIDNLQPLHRKENMKKGRKFPTYSKQVACS